jgi:hypothetical protein
MYRLPEIITFPEINALVTTFNELTFAKFKETRLLEVTLVEVIEVLVALLPTLIEEFDIDAPVVVAPIVPTFTCPVTITELENTPVVVTLDGYIEVFTVLLPTIIELFVTTVPFEVEPIVPNTTLAEAFTVAT